MVSRSVNSEGDVNLLTLLVKMSDFFIEMALTTPLRL